MGTYIETLKKPNGDIIAPRTVADAVLMSDRRTVEEAVNAASTVHKTQADWEAEEYIAKEGEIVVYDQDDNYHYSRIKIGDGVTNVADLPFAALPTVESLDTNRLLNYGEDEYYFSQTLYDKFRKQNRVYVERGHVFDEETGKWRWRGPYPMYTLSYSAGKLANPWYYKETWYGDYYTANASTLSSTYATKAAFITACKEGTYDIPAPTDDDYPALDSVAQRLGASGNIVVPRTPTETNHAASKDYVDATAYKEVAKVAKNIVTGRQAYKVNNPGTKAVGINKTGGYIAQSFPLTSKQLKADHYIFETDIYLETLNWGGAGLQFSLWASNAVVAWFHLNNDYPCMLSNTLAHAENVTFNLADYAPSADFIHLRLEHHNSETPTITVYINGNKAAEKSFNSGRVGNISSAQLACTGAYKGRVELSNYALVNTTEANYQVKPSDWSDFSSFPANEGLVAEQTWGVTTATVSPYLAINREGLKTYTKDLLKGNLALGEGTEIGKMKGVPIYSCAAETEQRSIQLSYTTSDNGNEYVVTVTASEPLDESIEVQAAVEWEGMNWDATAGEYTDWEPCGTAADSRVLEVGMTSVTLRVMGPSRDVYDYCRGTFIACQTIDGKDLPLTIYKTTEHFVVTCDTTAGINVDDTYSIYQTSPAKTYANVGKVISIEGNKLYVDILPTFDTPTAGNKYYLMINGKDLGEFIDGHQVVLGQYNEIVEDATLVVGSGTSDTERSNAFVIYEDGRVTVGKEPVESNEIVPKSYVDAQTIPLASKQARKVYTPGEKALGINKTGSYLAQELSRTTAQTNAKYSIFEFDLYNDTTVWGGAGLQFAMLAGSTEIAFLMLYNNATLSMISNNTAHTDNTTFKFADFISNNNYAHIRLEHHNISTPKVVLYINGRKAAEQTSSIGSGLASKAKITCTNGYKGRVELSNIAFINATDANYEIAEADLLDLSQYPVNEGLATAHKWGVTTATTSSLFTVNKLYLDNNNTKVLKQSSAQATAALNSALTNYVPTLTSSNTHDKLYAEFANNEGRGEYYVTNPDDIIITNRGVPYSADNGYFKSRYPQQTVDWGDDIPETMSKVLYEQYPSGVAYVSTEASSTYKDNRTVLKVEKDAQGEANSAENINFLAQVKEDGGHKFVFETEISWGGVTGFIAGSGNWCARMHFVADDKTTRMCAVDNDCDITFDKLQTTNNETWFAIGPSAEYTNCYKVASNKTWALLRVEMIDKTLVVFVNDKKVYEQTRDTNLSTFDRSLYGFRIEFRGYAKNTTFYLNNTFVGTVNEDFFGRPSPSIPQRLDNGQINVPVNPVNDSNAASKAYVDSKSVPQEYIDEQITSVTSALSKKDTSLENEINKLESRIGFLEVGYTEGLAYESIGSSYWLCTGIGTATGTDIVIPNEIDGKPVVAIAEGAFASKRLNSIDIPASVTNIRGGALYNAAKTITIRMTDPQWVDAGGVGSAKFDYHNNYYAHYMFQKATAHETFMDYVLVVVDYTMEDDTYTEQINVAWGEDHYINPDAPWGASNATISYNTPLRNAEAIAKIIDPTTLDSTQFDEFTKAYMAGAISILLKLGNNQFATVNEVKFAEQGEDYARWSASYVVNSVIDAAADPCIYLVEVTRGPWGDINIHQSELDYETRIATLETRINELEGENYTLKTGLPAPTPGLVYSGNTCLGRGTAIGTDIVIASEVDGVEITHLAKDAFTNEYLNSLYIPETIMHFGKSSLYNAAKIVTVGCKYPIDYDIGSGAFGSQSSNWDGEEVFPFQKEQYRPGDKVMGTPGEYYYLNDTYTEHIYIGWFESFDSGPYGADNATITYAEPDVTVDYASYNLIEGEGYEVVSINRGAGDNIIIPDKINNIPVIGVADYGLNRWSIASTISLPDVKYIGHRKTPCFTMGSSITALILDRCTTVPKLSTTFAVDSVKVKDEAQLAAFQSSKQWKELNLQIIEATE